MISPKFLQIIFLFLVASCSNIIPEYETSGLLMGELYAKGKIAYESREWTECSHYFELMQRRYDPSNLYVKQAYLNAAYCRYQDHDLQEANQSIDDFINIYIGDPILDYAYYFKGIINFNDDLGLFGRLFGNKDLVDRDLETMIISYKAFKTLVDLFPRSRYALDATSRFQYITNLLVMHDVDIARYYYHRRAYLAAINRAKKALSSSLYTIGAEEALHIIMQSYQALGEIELAEDTRLILTSAFPNSRYRNETA